MVEKVTRVNEEEDGNNAKGLTVTKLAELPAGSMLDEKALAEVFAVSPRTIRRMIGRGELPPGVFLGARKIWFSEKVIEFLSQRAEQTAEERRKSFARM